MKRSKNSLIISVATLIAFALWTVAVCFVDVQQIGPGGSSVGLAGINGFIHRLTGVNFTLYNITDWLGLVPFLICAAFGVLGLTQWCKRKSIRKVDWNILALGIFYIVTFAAYLLFEHVVINRRPVLINGILEASYPSSTTMLTLCVMSTTLLQLHQRIKKKALRNGMCFAIYAFTSFMVIGRLICGVHWFSDIVGGALLSAGLVMMYHYICSFQNTQNL